MKEKYKNSTIQPWEFCSSIIIIIPWFIFFFLFHPRQFYAFILLLSFTHLFIHFQIFKFKYITTFLNFSLQNLKKNKSFFKYFYKLFWVLIFFFIFFFLIFILNPQLNSRILNMNTICRFSRPKIKTNVSENTLISLHQKKKQKNNNNFMMNDNVNEFYWKI